MPYIRGSRSCECCGKMMHDVHPLTRFCPDCVAERQRMQQRASQARRYAHIREENDKLKKPPKKGKPKRTDLSGLSLGEISRRAREAGMTYGKYVAMIEKGGFGK